MKSKLAAKYFESASQLEEEAEAEAEAAAGTQQLVKHVSS
jgi:hypothetical protein